MALSLKIQLQKHVSVRTEDLDCTLIDLLQDEAVCS